MLSFAQAIFKILNLFAVLVVLLVLGPVPCPAGKGVQGKGRVNTWVLNVRTLPAGDSKVAGTLRKGDVITVLGGDPEEGGWLEIRSNTVHGFVRNRQRYIVWSPGKSVADQGPGASKKEARQILEKIAARESEVDAFTEKETAIIEGLNEIELALNRMGTAMAKVKQELKTVKEQMAGVMEKKKALAATIDKNSGYVGARLSALYRVRMVGRMALFSMPDSMFDFFLQQNALEKIIGADVELLDSQMADLEGLAAVSRRFEILEKEKQRLEETLVEQMRLKTRESERRRAVLKEIQGEKKLVLAAVASLREAAEALEKKMTAFESVPSGDEKGFPLFKGLLGMPVQGTIITPYGPSKNSNYSSFTFEAGIDIRVGRGEPVRSVFKGEVLYAEWLKGYGNLIIINHGDNFYTLYAHVQEFFKKKGERVDTQEVIALAGDTGSIKGPCLHFEVRHHGQPVDPMKWLKKGA